MESRSSDRKLNPLPPDHFRHQDSAIAQSSVVSLDRKTVFHHVGLRFVNLDSLPWKMN
jgi:hypothetical protein